MKKLIQKQPQEAGMPIEAVLFLDEQPRTPKVHPGIFWQEEIGVKPHRCILVGKDRRSFKLENGDWICGRGENVQIIKAEQFESEWQILIVTKTQITGDSKTLIQTKPKEAGTPIEAVQFLGGEPKSSKVHPDIFWEDCIDTKTHWRVLAGKERGSLKLEIGDWICGSGEDIQIISAEQFENEWQTFNSNTPRSRKGI